LFAETVLTGLRRLGTLEAVAERTAEVAGAGLSGLTVAALLARRGWKVHVHERSDALREIGAGIFVWENGIRALEEAGCGDQALARAERINAWDVYDERGRQIQGGWMNPEGVRLYTALRTDLHRALVDAARRFGATIECNSAVAGATADGVLQLDDGRAIKADIVVGADGVGSRVRDSLGLAQRVTDLEDGCGRHLIPRADGDPRERTLEYWNGSRRVGIVPVSPDDLYVYLCCTAADVEGRRKPLDVASWTRSFPALASYLERIPDVGRWASFSDVAVDRWIAGRVCLLGDAAHAMSPNLGQGACVAMANAQALVHALDRFDTVAEALAAWEASERPITDHTQRYSRLYGRVGTKWPRSLLDVRSMFVRLAGRSQRLQHHVNRAATNVSVLVSGEAPPGDARW
jgi:2-polyprenyl-6-methoxyphenol hydroxylase-like FAD-dependent oxidoreductase